MRMSSRFVIASTTILGLASLLRSSPASACSPPERQSYVLVADGATVPANVQGLPVTLGFGGGGYELVRSDGSKVEAKVEAPAVGSSAAANEESLVVPSAPLEPGQYSLSLGGTAKATFTIGASTPAPSPAVTITVGAPQRARVTIGGGPSCTDEYDASVLDVTVQVAESYRPWRDLVALSGEKGEPSSFFWTLGPGDVYFGPPARGIPDTLTKTYRLARKCEQGAGRAKVTFAARVRGLDVAEAEATADLEFKACEGLPEAPASTPGTGGPSGAGGASGTPDAASSDDASDGGCSVSEASSAGRASRGGWLAALASLACVAHARRRRRR